MLDVAHFQAGRGNNFVARLSHLFVYFAGLKPVDQGSVKDVWPKTSSCGRGENGWDEGGHRW